MKKFVLIMVSGFMLAGCSSGANEWSEEVIYDGTTDMTYLTDAIDDIQTGSWDTHNFSIEIATYMEDRTNNITHLRLRKEAYHDNDDNLESISINDNGNKVNYENSQWDKEVPRESMITNEFWNEIMPLITFLDEENLEATLHHSWGVPRKYYVEYEFTISGITFPGVSIFSLDHGSFVLFRYEPQETNKPSLYFKMGKPTSKQAID